MKTQWLHVVLIGIDYRLSLAMIEEEVYTEVDNKEYRSGKQPHGEQFEEPDELGTAQIEHEQGWVAQGGEQSATVGHGSDEEENGVGLEMSFTDGVDERPYE